MDFGTRVVVDFERVDALWRTSSSRFRPPSLLHFDTVVVPLTRVIIPSPTVSCQGTPSSDHGQRMTSLPLFAGHVGVVVGISVAGGFRRDGGPTTYTEVRSRLEPDRVPGRSVDPSARVIIRSVRRGSSDPSPVWDGLGGQGWTLRSGGVGAGRDPRMEDAGRDRRRDRTGGGPEKPGRPTRALRRPGGAAGGPRVQDRDCPSGAP